MVSIPPSHRQLDRHKLVKRDEEGFRLGLIVVLTCKEVEADHVCHLEVEHKDIRKQEQVAALLDGIRWI